jgi:hypothetical protein
MSMQAELLKEALGKYSASRRIGKDVSHLIAPGTSLLCFRFPPSKTIRRAAMATTSRGRAQDRAKVAAGQDHEVRYEAKKEGVSKDTVKKAVKSAGNSRKKVETEIDRH